MTDREKNISTTKQSSLAILEHLKGLWVAHAIHVATRLRIADLLKDGPKSVRQLAEETGTQEDLLNRLLRALASIDIFTETGPGIFAQTSLSQQLRPDVPDSIYDMTCHLGADWLWMPWQQFEHGLKTGETPFSLYHKVDIWEYMAKTDPEAGKVFNLAMTSFSSIVNDAIAHSYDFSAATTVVDIGGGQGSLLTAILQTYPMLKGMLFDLPDVVESAREWLPEALKERVQLVSGSFFESLPEGWDIYMLKQVIHDWNHEDSVRILRNCRTAMKEGDRILIADRVIESGGVETSLNKFWDVHMHVIIGGRERTEAEFAKLYDDSGFKLTRIVQTGTPVSIVEGTPVTVPL